MVVDWSWYAISIVLRHAPYTRHCCHVLVANKLRSTISLLHKLVQPARVTVRSLELFDH